jgi:hypothetical protein
LNRLLHVPHLSRNEIFPTNSTLPGQRWRAPPPSGVGSRPTPRPIFTTFFPVRALFTIDQRFCAARKFEKSVFARRTQFGASNISVPTGQCWAITNLTTQEVQATFVVARERTEMLIDYGACHRPRTRTQARLNKLSARSFRWSEGR